jgi:hypothetical protein
MNAYEQLTMIRDQLEQNGASEETIALVEKFVVRAESERLSQTSVPQTMMIRHLLRQREAIDNYAVYNDLQELMSIHDARRQNDDDVRPAYEDTERHPRPHSYYRGQKAKDEKKK